MLGRKYKRYERLYIYLFKEGHPALRNLEDEDLIGYWEEDGMGILFFHVPKDLLIEKLCKEYHLECINKEVMSYEEWVEHRLPRPLKVGNLTIAPLWFEGSWDLVFDPSVVFGEGTHPTTYMMLELSWELYSHIYKPKSVLDIGCGSGILTLFWAKLGAEVIAVDLNPLCIRVTENNLRLNRLLQKVILKEGDILTLLPIKTDLVMANLYKGLLFSLFEKETFWVYKYYLFSGFTTAMEKEILEVLKKRPLELIRRKELEDWVGLLFKSLS